MDTGEGTTYGPDLPSVETVVAVAVAELTRLGRLVGWGFLGQSV